jgi:hypothetical protein
MRSSFQINAEPLQSESALIGINFSLVFLRALCGEKTPCFYSAGADRRRAAEVSGETGVK